MTAIDRKSIKIYIAAADTAMSTLTDTHVVAGEIVNYGQSGGGDDLESQPAFGGFIDKEKPREQFEVSLDVVPSFEEADRWDKLTYSAETVATKLVYTSAESGTGVTLPGKHLIAIEATHGDKVNTIAYNNVNVTNFTLDHSADDNLSGNITFKFSPTTPKGVANRQKGKHAATDMPSFSALANNA